MKININNMRVVEEERERGTQPNKINKINKHFLLSVGIVERRK